MRFLLVFVIFLLGKGYPKALNKKGESTFSQDSLYESSKISREREYVPLIDGQPIFIPEEFAEPRENMNETELDTQISLQKKNSFNYDNNFKVSNLEIDEVFPVDQRKDLKQKPSSIKYPQKLTSQEKDLEENPLEEIFKPTHKPIKRKNYCKVSQTNKIKKASDTGNFMKDKNIAEKYNLNRKDDSQVTSVIQSRNFNENTGVNNTDFLESSLQDEVKSMLGPSFKSFVFNPQASVKSKFQECKTSKHESGVCRYVQHCFLPNIISSIEQFMNNVCIIEKRFIGVCCPDFPVQVVSVNWKNDLKKFDDPITAPTECGIGTNNRIVGGSEADIKAWPWMVALLNNRKSFFCGGALINNRYVLTAAHCTFGVKNHEIIARVGDLSKDKGEDYRVVEMKRHGQYNSFTLRNDIALLKLEKPVFFNEFIKTICFPNQTKNYTGRIATLTGWGRLRGGVSSLTSDILQQVEFPIVTNEKCASSHGLPIPESLICTSAPSKDKSACNGDSGGPLMLLDDENRWKVIGIVSWGRRGCNTEYPSVFTRVSYYLDWIKQHASF